MGGDGKLTVNKDADSFVLLWDAQTGRQVNKLRGHKGAVMAVAFWPDDKTLVSGGTDGIVRLWEPQAPGSSPRKPLPPSTGPVYSVAVSSDGRLIASGGADKTVTLWSNK
jgi:WD40 repeat protein